MLSLVNVSLTVGPPVRCIPSTASRRLDDPATKKKISEDEIEPSILSV